MLVISVVERYFRLILKLPCYTNYTHSLFQAGQPFARHAPIFSNVSRDALYRRTFLVTMVLHIISDLPGYINKYKWNLW